MEPDDDGNSDGNTNEDDEVQSDTSSSDDDSEEEVMTKMTSMAETNALTPAAGATKNGQAEGVAWMLRISCHHGQDQGSEER